MVEIRRNLDRDGLEINFPEKPLESTINWLKQNHYRWSRFAKVWYKKYDDYNWNLAHQYFNIPLSGEIAIPDLSTKTVAELDELISQLESGMKDVLAQGDTQKADKLKELIGTVIDYRNRDNAEYNKVVNSGQSPFKERPSATGKLNPAPSLLSLAQKYGMTYLDIKPKLELGTNIEFEHTKDVKIAETIALQHLDENINYYSDPKPKNWAEKELKEEKPSTMKKTTMHYKLHTNDLADFLKLLKDLIPHIKKATIFSANIGEEYMTVTGDYDKQAAMHPEISVTDFDSIISDAKGIRYKRLSAKPQPEKRWKGKWVDINTRIKNLEKVLSEEEPKKPEPKKEFFRETAIYEPEKKESAKIVVIPNTVSAYDKQAQKFIKEFISKTKVSKLVSLADKNMNYEVYAVFTKIYPEDSEILLFTSIDSAYKGALNSDLENLNIVKAKKQDNIIEYDYFTGSLFGDFLGEYYDEKGNLKQEVKDNAIRLIKERFEGIEKPKQSKVGSVRPEFMQGAILKGREIQISMPNGEKRNSQFVIVELDNIIASHNEENFHSEPLYPKNASGNNINDRNYKDDLSAQKAVMDYAKDLEPERLITTSRTPSGTPIITTDGFVVSGNNRAMSMKLAKSKYPENYKAYVKYLAEEIESFGFENKIGHSITNHYAIPLSGSTVVNPKEVRFNYPVLVRIDYDFKEYTTQELAKYNKDTKKSERPVDKAIKLSNILRENTRCADIIAEITGEYETFSEFYVNIPGQKRLAKALVECNLLTEQELPAYFSETTFTETGKEFIENLLAALVLNREALLATEQPGVKATRQKLITSLPVLMKNAVLPEGSLIQNINDAVILQQIIKTSGSEFPDFIRQRNLFGTKYDRKTVYLNSLINSGKFKFKQAIEGYNDAILKNQGASLFGEKPSLDEIFDHWIKGGVSDTDQRLIEGSDVVSRGDFKLSPEQIAKIKPEWDKMQEFFKETDEKIEEVDVYNYQDEHAERIVGSSKWDGGVWRFKFENAGDILRELAKYKNEFLDPSYIYEKVNAIEKFIPQYIDDDVHPDDQYKTLKAKHSDVLAELREAYVKQPTMSEAQDQAKTLVLNLIDGNLTEAQKQIDYFNQFRGKKNDDGEHSLMKANTYRTKQGKTDYRKELLRDQEGLKIYLVDGEAVRKDHIEFVAGGHGYVYDWIPKEEVWIDDNQKSKPDDMEATIKHELFEIGKMRDEGLSYDDAHELANKVESEERNKEEVTDPVERKANEVRDNLIQKGYVVRSGGDSKTDFGHSIYLLVNRENNPLNNPVKVRISDHSVENIDRIRNEKHFHPMDDMLDPLMYKEIDYILQPELFREEQGTKDFTTRFETPKPLDTDKVISERMNQKGTHNVYTVDRKYNKPVIRIIDTRDNFVLGEKVDTNAMEKEVRNEPGPIKSQILDVFLPKVKIIKPFISQSQMDALTSLYRSEEKEGAIDIATRLAETIESMPKTYETDNIKASDKIIHLHYFIGGSDWYIAEKDSNADQNQMFGYAILNGDDINAEWGYVSAQELKENNVELDFYWTPKPFKEIKKVQDEEEIEIPISVGAGAGSFADAKIGEWQQVPTLDATYKIEKIEKTYPMYVDGWRYEMTIGYPESLGENGNYDTGNFFKEIPSIGEIEKEIRELYEEEYKDLETSNSGRDENIRNAIGKALGITQMANEAKQPVKASPKALPTVDYNNKTYFIDFRLQEIRDKQTAQPTKFTEITSEELKAAIRFIRSGQGQNVYMEGLDEPTPTTTVTHTKQGRTEPTISTFSLNPSDYSNDFQLNKGIERLLDAKWNDKPDQWSASELEFIKNYSGYGGLDEFGQITKGSLFEFYTPEKVIEKMWGLAYKYGYNEGRLAEPSSGVGLFLKREYVKSSVIKDAYEINKYSAKICKLLYPETNVNDGEETKYFEQLFIKNNYTVRDKVSPVHSLVIGNPPYGEAQGLYMGMGEKTYTHAKNYIDYFIFRGLDLLVKDGLLIYIIGAEVASGGVPWLDQGNSKCKEMIAEKGKLIDAYRLPEGLFARTNVVSDIVVFKKKV